MHRASDEDLLGWSPKFESTRDVALTPRAIKILQKLKDDFKNEKIVGYIRGEEKPFKGNFVFSIKDFGRHNDGGRRRVDGVRKAWQSLLKEAGVKTYDFDGLNFHDFRRYRNEMNDKVKGMSAEERGLSLGNSKRVNQTHYKGKLDDEVLQMAAEIRALKEEILTLREKKSLS